MVAYLFDTSGIRSIGRQVLMNAQAQGHRLLLSTISCFELTTHLDDEDFRLAHGNSRKALLCEILDDPLAEIMADVGCREAVHLGRFQDRPVVHAILHELEQANSYADLMARETEIEGQVRPIGDIASNARQAFDDDRSRFLEAMKARCEALTQRYERDGAIHLSGEQFCREAMGLADVLFEVTQDKGCRTTRNEIADRTVLGCGYGVARACMYIGSVGANQPIRFDGNDYEDYLISLHLGVTANRTFVTNDRGARAALDRTVASFEQYFSASGSQFAREVNVITPDEFCALYRRND